ncbi:MAG: hypothetical protein D6737_09730 [Chloroflexi bacterium]|nr:MAG: hypothetical protein CUN54_08640 [Phototrophicales bacterium]RMF79944.1 MAG: hypothetical protein D6737_09730 [Chloroflexota bacterium]
MTRWFMLITILLIIGLIGGGAPALAQEDTTLDIIPIASGRFVHVRLSPDGNFLATYENSIFIDNEVFAELLPITVVDLSSNEPVTTQFTGHTDYVRGLAFTSDNSKLISLHTNGDLNVWDVAAGTLEKTILTGLLSPGPLPLHLLSDDSTIVIPGAGFNVPLLQLWDTSTGHMTHILTQHFDTFVEFDERARNGPPNNLSAYATSPVDDRVVGVMANTNIWLWDGQTGEGVLAFETFIEPRFNIRRVIFSNNGEQILFHNRETEQVHIWDINTIDEIATLPINTPAFDVLADDSVVWMNEDGKSFSLMRIDALGDVTTIALSDLLSNRNVDALLNVTFDDLMADTRAQQNLRLFEAAANRIVIGGIVNEEDNTNFIAVVTLDS